MEISVAFKHMESKDIYKEYAEEKSERFKKFFDGKIHVRWTLAEATGGNRTVHCHLTGSHMDYFGEATTHDLYEAMDDVADKIESQLRKHKEQIRNH